MCKHIGVAIFSQWSRSRRDTGSCARTHAQFNVVAVAARVHARPKIACMREISSKTVILFSMANNAK